jgi:D-serine deaminase-like pyridoxal phosphate-dependent protein
VRAAVIDDTAVAALGARPADWRYKGLPADAAGLTLAELAGQRRDLFDGGFSGPLVVLDEAAVAHNVATMAAWCAERGLLLAPHGKTTMAPQLFARQLAAGACAITVATASQVRVCRAFGVSRVQLANELVDPAALRWLAAELAADPDFEFSCWADSAAGVAVLDAALRAAGARRPLDVLVEVGAPGKRAGVRDLPTALGVAAAVADSPVLRLAGVAGYEGAVVKGTDAAALNAVDEYLTGLRGLATRLAADGLLTGPIVVTAGGSAYFDRVAAVLGEPWPAGLDVRPVLRSGAYVTHDDGIYRASSPFNRTGDGPFRPALHAWAQVSSRPEPGLALLTLGKRDASFDEGLPEPQRVRGADGAVRPLTGAVVHKLMDQHCFLRLGPDDAVEVGDWVRLGLSHPCTVFDKWPLLPVLAGDGDTTVVDFVHTFF